ncbi:MAG: GNAT family N-acetyltransferase [Clostridium sp.]|uniref:GNAT family N-acetyltransferase n=1 Tax=Clostridium sp. TaxID=1506 RepID=UPI003D6C816F
MNIRFEPVTKGNYRECIEMPKLEHVASNMFSIVQAYVLDRTYPFCIFNEDKMIGFVMYKIIYDDEEDIDIFCMNRLYIAEEYQNKGYGRVAVNKLLQMIKEKHSSEEIYTSTHHENHRALHLYESIGFKRNGEMDDDEVVLVYRFRK